LSQNGITGIPTLIEKSREENLDKPVSFEILLKKYAVGECLPGDLDNLTRMISWALLQFPKSGIEAGYQLPWASVRRRTIQWNQETWQTGILE
jgi:hypothetical protein